MDTPQGFVKIVKTFLVPTQIGDHYLNTDSYDFSETKDGKFVIVEEKVKEN
jgi:hypothetical protein